MASSTCCTWCACDIVCMSMLERAASSMHVMLHEPCHMFTHTHTNLRGYGKVTMFLYVLTVCMQSETDTESVGHIICQKAEDLKVRCQLMPAIAALLACLSGSSRHLSCMCFLAAWFPHSYWLVCL